jgi:hypothetical protein
MVDRRSRMTVGLTTDGDVAAGAPPQPRAVGGALESGEKGRRPRLDEEEEEEGRSGSWLQ